MLSIEIELNLLSDKSPEKEKQVLLCNFEERNFDIAFLTPEDTWWNEYEEIDVKYYTHWGYLKVEN